MGIQSSIERQKAELESVLSSDAFRRAPNLTRLLRFVCEKYWEGKGNEIKEYTLAVEVLGRSTDFDPLTDSIVRVELHRLREKLKDYYRDPGRPHEFRILLRSGTYIPEFLPANSSTGNGSTSEAAPPPMTEVSENRNSELVSSDLRRPERPPAPSPPDGRRKRQGLLLGLPWIGVGAGGIVLLLLATWQVHRSSRSPVKIPATILSSNAASPTLGQEIRVMAGYTKGEYYTDRFGKTWLSDRYFEGGAPLSFPRQVTALATDPTLYETARWGRFTYSIPLTAGMYELRLYFMERMIGPGTIGQGGENTRLFSVLLNGKPILSGFDPYSDAGGNFVGHIRAFKGITPGPEGHLRIDFIPARDEPFLNALEIIPTPDGRAPPFRIVAQENSVTDSEGRIWEPDQFYRGGILLRRQSIVTGTADPDLYGGERYGHFSYVIPVPEGSYRLTLYFAEAYFGSQDNRSGGIGSRVFDLYCNGQALLRDFDVYREAGGTHRALVKTFHGLRANPQGQLALDFVPVKNYAMINAIEVVDESKGR